jgi:uncharacterized phage protein (TIGR01671 family)
MNMKKNKFRVWNGYAMEYRVLVGNLGAFYVEGMSKTDTACLSDANTIYHESTPVTQFTGFKEINGVEIYEGDLVNYITEFKPYIEFKNEKVWFEEDIGAFVFGECYYDGNHGWLFNQLKNVEVVGNIHKNPELYKKEKNT